MVDEFFYMGWQSILRLSHSVVSRERERPTTEAKEKTGKVNFNSVSLYRILNLRKLIEFQLNIFHFKVQFNYYKLVIFF